MDRVRQSRSATNSHIRCHAGRAVRLDNAVQELLDDQILPRQNIFDLIEGLWSQLLPSELIQHCKIDDISGGLLKVRVDSPLYALELRLCSSELIRELQRRCPSARIKKIKINLT